MPNPKLETYKNKATGTVYDYTDAAAQAALADILDGTDIDSFGDVETALATKVDKVTGKGLSTNDYDNTEKAKVAGAFPRSEQAVLGAGNLLDKTKATGVTADVEVTQTTTGVRGVVANASTWKSIAIIIPNPVKNYGLTLASNVEITSGQALLKVEGFDGTTFTPISESTPITTSGRLKLTFNTGSYPYLRIQLYVTGGATVNTGDITYNDLCLSTDPDPIYAPYAMTNQQLTNKTAELNRYGSLNTNNFRIRLVTAEIAFVNGTGTYDLSSFANDFYSFAFAAFQTYGTVWITSASVENKVLTVKARNESGPFTSDGNASIYAFVCEKL